MHDKKLTVICLFILYIDERHIHILFLICPSNKFECNLLQLQKFCFQALELLLIFLGLGEDLVSGSSGLIQLLLVVLHLRLPTIEESVGHG